MRTRICARAHMRTRAHTHTRTRADEHMRTCARARKIERQHCVCVQTQHVIGACADVCGFGFVTSISAMALAAVCLSSRLSMHQSTHQAAVWIPSSLQSMHGSTQDGADNGSHSYKRRTMRVHRTSPCAPISQPASPPAKQLASWLAGG